MLSKKYVICGILLGCVINTQLWADDMSDAQEACQLLSSVKTCWQAQDYLQAKNLIDAKLTERPGWIPAVILKSSYYRWVENDLSSALGILGTISTSGLDADKYKLFLAFYPLYYQAIQIEASESWNAAENAAKLAFARQVYVYFPGSELVAYYFLWTVE